MFRQKKEIRRFMLWIDSVDAFMLCTAERVSLGRPAAYGEERSDWADIAIMADLSRHHAEFIRDGESYLIESQHPVRVNGEEAGKLASLRDGDRIDLGGSVSMKFRKPNALSSTATLELLTIHRTEPRAKSIVLMAEMCLLGPDSGSHIICPGWSRQVILTLDDGQLSCRPGRQVTDLSYGETKPQLRVDRRPVGDRGIRVTPGARIEGDGITGFSVEAL